MNKEQSPKQPTPARLTQEAIDRAFANKPRVSNYVLSWDKYSFVLLSGKNTGRLQVVSLQSDADATLDVTSLERSLIDAAVRPVYCGGAKCVLDAYRAAKPNVNVESLLATLAGLGHSYPYHQAVGFYMQHAGFDAADLRRTRGLGVAFDFYLTNHMKAPKYSAEWKLYYPADLPVR